MSAEAQAAAQKVITALGVDGRYHSVKIRNEWNAETGEVDRKIQVAIRPGHEHRVSVPAEMDGFTVEQIRWR